MTLPSARSLRLMAYVRWALLASVTALAAYSAWTSWRPSSPDHAAHTSAGYYCPMHPQIRSTSPGTCPICHMNLEPIPMQRVSITVAPASRPAPSGVTPLTVSIKQQESIGLTTTLVTSSRLGKALRVPGVVTASEGSVSQVRVRAAGFVERVLVRQTGVRVLSGQTLALIYSPEIYRAQEELLAATRFGAAASAAEAPHPAAALVVAARRNLQLLGLTEGDLAEILRSGEPMRAVPVRAPSAGVVTVFNAVLGFRADPETLLYELTDLTNLWVVASVHERDAASIQVGMPAELSLMGRRDEVIAARVDLIEPELDEASRTMRIRLTVPNRSLVLRPGQFADVSFALAAMPGLFVPRDAVIHTGEHTYLYVAMEGDRFEPRSVRIGAEVAGSVQIVDGVSAGERVVTRGNFMLDSESRLQASLAATPGVAPTKLAPPTSRPER